MIILIKQKMFMNKSTKSFLMIAVITLLSACTKINDKEQVLGCDPVTSYARFQIADKLSGEDLFFSANPKYQLKDINLFKSSDKSYKDTIKTLVGGSGGSERYFLLRLNFNKPKDTLVVRIADTPNDQLIYTVKRANNPCEGDEIGQAYFNNTEVVIDKMKLIFKK